ncbi:HAD family hydrolase [uncultured Helicobacter sp.]|uniref:HAD family hydrolase n=1 Tax=uncultured Helicobacter sp. TaxID=175537 RepID=UPI00374F7DBA
MSNIAFFDFDGTITKKDSLFVFVKFAVGKWRFYRGLGARFWILLGYVFGLCSNTYAKEALMRYFFRGYSAQEFALLCANFQTTLCGLTKIQAMEKIAWHKDRGDVVVVVSATFEEYLKPFCQNLGLECLATRLEVVDGTLSGKFATPNCYGEQKVVRIKAHYDLSQYQEIYAYGDSKGDYQMLALATQRFYKKFA